MAKELVAGETVGAIDDDGPEEGEIEDDTSEEDGPEKKISSNPVNVGSPMEVNFYQPPSSSKTEPHVGKSKAYSEEKKIAWRSAKRRIYRLYVDHDKPSRDSYKRLTKSDLNSDHREINFQDLLKDYRTSKHGNEGKLTVSPDAICFGNSHEKENRHFTKEARTDTSRKHESVVIESQEEKLKRNRKRKQHRSPSRDRNSSVSSDTDGVRKRKDPRNIRQRRNWKTPTRVGNLKGSAALFAQIRASKLNALSASVQQKTQGEGIPSYIDITTEVSELQTGVSSTIQPVEGTCEESKECTVEVLADEEPHVNESSKSLCSASDSQTAERNEDSESKDEEDDVNQLRMLALQSAFRAKYLERKRRGMIVKKHSKRAPLQNPPSEAIADLTFNLDDTADLLEAAVEEAVSSSANKETAPSAIENWQPTLFSSLSEVPLPPDDPPVRSPVEDLTPVDMELALTDEEENANPCPNIGNDITSDSVELQKHRLRTTSSSSKARSIPVTIGGRTLVSKPRKRMTHTPDKTRCNLLEVTTCISRGEAVEEPNSTDGNMVDMNMASMLVLDAVGTCSSPENGPQGDDEHALSEVSDTKSDLVSYSNSKGFSGSIVDDEDEEILRARLLVEISRRHRRGNIPSNTLKLEETKDRDAGATFSPVHEMVSANTQPGNVIRPIGKSVTFTSANLPSAKVKVPLKRSVERTRRGQLLAKVRNRQVSMQSNAQASLSPYAKTYLSKVISRGKYQRVNQNRLAVAKKRIDGNLHVTVMGRGSKSQSINTVPQQQDRIVICLGDDSEESDDERQAAVSKRFPNGNNLPLSLEKPLPNPAEIPESLAISNVSSSSPQLVVDSHFPSANISADFEKSVDRFLKEVRSVQESRLQDEPPPLETQLKSENIIKKKVDVPVAKLINKSDVTSTSCRVTSKANVVSVVPKAALRSNAAPATPKVAVNAVKSKPTNQIVKAGNGVTPQAVRHLPPPQQEEYRRLKMQISVLEELHKKRKAAEILHASRRNEVLNQGKGSGSTVPSGGPKSKVQISSQRDPNFGGYGSSSKGSGESLGIKITDKPLESVSGLSNSLSGDDVEEEDVNLLREQLLRSRLQKKMNAMAETSVKISETSPVPNQGIVSVPVTIVNPVNVPHQLSGEGDTSCAEPVMKSSTAIAVAGIQGKITTTCEVTVGFSDVPETALRTLVTGKKSLQSPNSSVVVNSESAKCGKVEADVLKASTVVTKKTDLSVRDLSQAVENVSLMAGSQEDGIEQSHRVGGSSDGTEGNSDVQAAVAQPSHVTSRTTGTGVLASSASFPPENQDKRATELAELEFQLLSERHAALQHLSELSSLLSKMEIEGAHLRQKEIAAQKLRAELDAMESSIAVQKDFLKQLALTISSTHERVTSTRQRCSMLCHSCTKLGNQLKQDKRANGGKIGTYQVPTGGAALVKSQLSSVLWQTKQLKKSGLPFLRGQNFVASGKVPTAKRLPRQTVSAPVPWSSTSTLSLDSLKISSSNDSVVPPSNPNPGRTEIPGIGEKSAPLINRSSTNDAFSIPKTLGSSGVILPSAPRKLSSSQGAVLLPEKPVVTTSGFPGTNTSESNVGAKVEELKLKGSVSEVPSGATTSSSQSVEVDVSRPVNSSPAVTEVILSQSGQEPVMSVSLRDYHSPLEPITKRINAEMSCPTNSSQQEESMTLDPNVILCPYDLMGECQDEECTYQHQRRKGMVKGS